jgi:hypothetical protein
MKRAAELLAAWLRGASATLDRLMPSPARAAPAEVATPANPPIKGEQP